MDNSPKNGGAQYPMPDVRLLFLVSLSFGFIKAIPIAEIPKSDLPACLTGEINNYTQILFDTHTCCNSCQPGTHMTKPCDTGDPSTTECSPCDPNTFTEHPNLLGECLPQYPCLEQFGQKTVKQGTATNNYECSCMDGYEEMADGHCRRLRMPDKHRAKTTRFHDPPQAGVSNLKHTTSPFTTPFTTSLKFTSKQLLTDMKQPVLSSKMTTVAIDKNDLVKGTTADPFLKPTENKAVNGKDGSISTNHIIVIVSCSTVGIVAIVAIVAISYRKIRNQGYSQVHHDAKKGKGIENAYETDEQHLDNESARSSFISAFSGRGTHGDAAKDTVSNSTAYGVMECDQAITTLNNPNNLKEPSGLTETGKPKSLTSLHDIESALLQPNDDCTQSSALDN